MANLSLSLLGPFQARLDDEPLRRFRTQKVQALLIYLAVEATQIHRRENLMALLWPDLPLKSAQLNLRQTIHRLRRTLPQVGAKNGHVTVPYLLVDRQTVQINPEAAVEVDLLTFTDLVTKTPTPDRLEMAVTLYRGDFLADFYLPDSETFEAWASGRREEGRRLALEALETLTDHYEQKGTYDQAEVYAWRQIDLDDLRESAYRQLMTLLSQSGQRSAALEQYQLCRQRLHDALGIEPADETTALYERIRSDQLAHNHLAVPQPELPQTLISHPRHNLPAQSTPFIGRETELTALDDLIADLDLRLVTIVGPGGMGKTRLALAAAERQLRRTLPPVGSQAEPVQEKDLLFPHGIHFVELTPLSETERIVPTIANALNFRLQTETDDVTSPNSSPKQELFDYLRKKRLLLILDNFEHLLEGASLLAEILQAAPAVQILTTSRERLHLQEEQVYPIQGLDFPDWETPEDAIDYTAAKLFLQSAQRVQPNFALRSDDLAYLTRICRLVTGMPLGIELAASWVDMLSLADIAAEIQKSLDFLETDIRNVPARHRSIRAVFDYSWQQLNRAEQQIFPELSIFRGGFTRQAAQTITGASLRLLATLVSKSLLQFNQERDRYEIHELLRQYGAEKLSQDPALAEQVQDRHSAYYCAWLQDRFTEIKGPQLLPVLTRIEADIENAQVAWNWAAGQGDMGRIDQAIDGLVNYYGWLNRLQDGLTACKKVIIPFTQKIDRPETLSRSDQIPPVLAKVLLDYGRFHLAAGEIDLGGQLFDQVLAILDSPSLAGEDTQSIRASLLRWMGDLALYKAQDEVALAYFKQSLTLYQTLADDWAVADVLANLGMVERLRGNYQQAKAYLEESLALYQEQGSLWRVGNILNKLGWITRESGHYQPAKDLYQAALNLSESINDLWGMEDSLLNLAYLGFFQGEFEAAKGYIRQSLTYARKIGRPIGITVPLLQLGVAHWFCGDFDRSQELMTESIDILKDLETPYGLAEATVFQAAVSVHQGQYEIARSQTLSALRQGEAVKATFVVSRANRLLGWLALVEKNYLAAYQQLQESISLHRQTSKDQEILAWTLAPLGRAALGLGNCAEAQHHLYQALQLSLDIQAFIPTLFIMPVVALALAAAGQLAEALTWWAFAGQYPFVSHSPMLKEVIGQPLAALTATLPADVQEAARARGLGGDHWAMLTDLLPKLSALGWAETESKRLY